MTNKEKYDIFCDLNYVPIYSKPWWLDVVCGPENWDVWLYYNDKTDNVNGIEAAMPYYVEKRGSHLYITKAPLSQNNGIIFKQFHKRKIVSQAKYQEKVINAACAFISSLQIDVYEQQFHYSFQNWQPYFWNNYTCTTRYTYVIQDTSDMAKVIDNFSTNCRNSIRKGQFITQISRDISPDTFYSEHEKVFLRQNRSCPFSRETWYCLYKACIEHDAGQMFCAKDTAGNIHALLFLVWDEASVYHLLGGYMPEFSSSQAYSALIYHGICVAHEKGLPYDFEGSMIRQIAVAFRQFGGIPTPYYRIRKVFNPEIVWQEAESYIRQLQESNL